MKISTSYWKNVLLGILSAFAVAYVVAACTPQQKAKSVNAIGNTVSCILMHNQEPPEAIVKACVGTTVEDVVSILMAQRNAMAKAQCPATPDAGPPRSMDIGPGK